MLVGENIGPFKVDKELGSGAMGTVYRATFAKDGRSKRVAIKVIAPGLGDNERIQARFEREASILKQLKHPNIVRLLATGKFQGRPFYAMEYIEGYALDKQLGKQGHFPWEKVVELGKQVCAALQHAHDNGIIHRDLKPSNLMVDRDGNLKLADFGIAKDSDMTGQTSANSTVGTAAYMSPEQCRGERDLTPKSDLYALGIVLYELLTGRKPFHAENAMDMFIQHVSGSFERPARHVMDIPPWLDTLVCQLMEKKPEHRPADARTVAQALDDVKQRVESHKSLGAEIASKVARKGAGKERQLAEEIVAGKRIKKRKQRSKAEFRKQLATAAMIVVALAGLTLLLIYGIQGPGPAKLLAKAQELIEKGDKEIKAKQYAKAWEPWDDAKTKYLHKIVGSYPESEEAKSAREKLDYIEAGQRYRHGMEIIDNDPQKNWQKAVTVEFDKLFNMKSPVAKPFIDLARQEIEKYEAPELLRLAQSKANPNKPEDWDEALGKLGTLVARYPDWNQAGKAINLKIRIEKHRELVAKIKAVGLNKLKEDPSWEGNRNAFMMEAANALADEILGEKEAAKAKWQLIVKSGEEAAVGMAKKNSELTQNRPWVDLARAKLEESGK